MKVTLTMSPADIDAALVRDEQINAPQFLDQWVRDEKARIIRFRQWWRDEAKKNSDAFPPSLSPGDWDEQYRCWSEG